MAYIGGDMMYRYNGQEKAANKNLGGMFNRDGLISSNDDLLTTEEIINKYFSDAVRYCDYKSSKLKIADILSGMGFCISECVLLGMPNYYNRMGLKRVGDSLKVKDYGCLTEHTVRKYWEIYKSKERSLSVYDYIMGKHYKSSYDRNSESLKSLGAIEINFFMIDDLDTTYRLLIDMYTGYAVLYDGSSIKVYGINRKLYDGIAKKYLDMGIGELPDIFLMAIFRENSHQISEEEINAEYAIYQKHNPKKTLSRKDFAKIFKDQVMFR